MPISKTCRPVALFALIATAGCGATGIGRADTAHVRVEAEQSARIVISTLFLPSAGSVTLIEADTFEVSAPLDRTIDLPNPPRFYIQAFSPSADNEVLIQVEIGDEPWLDARRTIGPEAPLEFAYGFNGLAF